MFFQHGHQIIKELQVASGLCTEQPSEHCNKIVMGNREHHSRQNSVATNFADVFNRQHYSADPKILFLMSKKLIKNQKRKDLPKGVSISFDKFLEQFFTFPLVKTWPLFYF